MQAIVLTTFSFSSVLGLRGRALKPQQVRISIPWCSPGYPCCTLLSSGRVTYKQFPVCVAVNDVFGNRERLILASANSAASSSTASSSSNDLETAMESWWTKDQKIKVINGTTTNLHSTNAPVWWEFMEMTLGVLQSAGFFISDKERWWCG